MGIKRNRANRKNVAVNQQVLISLLDLHDLVMKLIGDARSDTPINGNAGVRLVGRATDAAVAIAELAARRDMMDLIGDDQ